MARCEVCFRHCVLTEGETGACGARICRDNSVVPKYYGQISSIALDPIEKKPLAHFFPGSRILSTGSLGCNLRCPFCQNYEIAQRDRKDRFRAETRQITPEELAGIAEKCRSRGNIGVAFTYNEPLVGYEFLRDTARFVQRKGMKNVLVTNGSASQKVLEIIAPWTDAMNIDLKGFRDRYYQETLKGSMQMVKDFIREAVKNCHVELTTLIVPGENDTEEEIRELSAWVAKLQNVYGGKQGREIPLHISRFFPRYRMTDRPATDVKKIYRLAETARENLKYVHTGNC